MAPTSDERREVAERLRDEADGFRRLENELGQLTIDLGEVTAVFQDVAHFAGLDGTVRTCVLLDRIADLIDPTCEAAYDNPFASDFNYRCMACGEHFSTCGEPKYCPGCGGRIEHVK